MKLIRGLISQLRDDEFTQNPFDWTTRGFTKWRTGIDNTCYSLWTIQQFFVTEGINAFKIYLF